MADNALQNPLTRDQLINAMQAGTYIPGQTGVTAAPGDGSGANSDVPIDANSEAQRIADFGTAQRQAGYSEVEAAMKRRGTLRSGQTMVGDQTVAETARVQSEAQLAKAKLDLYQINLQQRQLKLQETEQKQASAARAVGLGTEIAAQQSTGALQTAQAGATTLEAQTSAKAQAASEALGMRAAATAEAQTAIASRAQTTAENALTEQSNARIADQALQRALASGKIADPQTGEYVETVEARKITQDAANLNLTLAADANNLKAQLDNAIKLGNISKETATEVAKMSMLTSAQGFDITTPQGAQQFRDYVKSQGELFNLTATQQKELEIAKISSGAAGFNLTTAEGQKAYNTYLQDQANKFQLSADDQKNLQKAQIAQSASGYDLTTSQGMSDYTKFIKEQASTYQLSAEDQRNQFAWNFNQQAKQFDMTQQADVDKFLAGLKEGARQFDISQSDQMAITRSQLLNDANLAALGVNAQMLTNLTEIATSQNAMLLGSGIGSDLDVLLDGLSDTSWAKDPKYGITLPQSASIADSNGVTSADRATYALGSSKPDATTWTNAFADFQKSFGADRGQTAYNAKYDFNRDGKINHDDYFVIASFYPS